MTRIFELAAQQGVSIRVITPDDRTQVDLLDVPLSTKVLLEQSLDAGNVLLSPIGQVQVNGESRFGWFEFDLESGETIGRLEDGTNGAFADRAAIEAVNPASIQ